MDFSEQQAATFEEANRRYDELKRRHDAGEVDDEHFDTEYQRLMVHDNEGRWWAKTLKSGGWHYYDGRSWVRGIPPGRQSTPQVTLPMEEHASVYQPPAERQAWWRQNAVLSAVAAAFAGVVWIALGILIYVYTPLSIPSIAQGHPRFKHAGRPGGLHIRQAPTYGRLGLVGFLAAFVANRLLMLLSFLPLYVLFLGYVLLGIATLRAGVLPSWSGVVLITLITLWPVRLLLPTGVHDSAVLSLDLMHGLVWLALGYALWFRRNVTYN